MHRSKISCTDNLTGLRFQNVDYLFPRIQRHHRLVEPSHKIHHTNSEGYRARLSTQTRRDTGHDFELINTLRTEFSQKTLLDPSTLTPE